MFTVPLSLIGVSWVLYLSKTPLSVVVALGFIMLGGIVVNNGILLIDFINLARKQGMGIIEAAVQASKVRARPIFMTSLTTIFGLLPLAFALGEGSELRAPMARTVMGGMASAAFLTLFVVPSVYIVLETIKEKLRKLLFPTKKERKEIVLMKPRRSIIEEIDVSSTSSKKQKSIIEESKPKATFAKPESTTPKTKKPEDDAKDLTENKTERSLSEVSPPISPKPIAKPVSDVTPEQKSLTQRQMQVLSYLRNNQKITRLEYVVNFKVPLPIADKELDEMITLGLLESDGTGSHKIYILKIDKKES